MDVQICFNFDVVNGEENVLRAIYISHPEFVPATEDRGLYVTLIWIPRADDIDTHLFYHEFGGADKFVQLLDPELTVFLRSGDLYNSLTGGHVGGYVSLEQVFCLLHDIRDWHSGEWCSIQARSPSLDFKHWWHFESGPYSLEPDSIENELEHLASAWRARS